MDSKVTEYLIKARDLLSDPKRWTKGMYARNSANEAVPKRSEDAVCWCALGAVHKVIDGSSKDFRPVLNQLRAALGGNTPVASFNDHPFTTHADVMALFDRAIEASRKES